jgi:hypothetical protein
MRAGHAQRGRRVASVALAAAALALATIALTLALPILGDESRYRELSAKAQAAGAATRTGGDSAGAADRLDWRVILKECPSAVGWLSVQGTSIDYPVMQAGNHGVSYWLSHDAWGRRSQAGCLVLDERCSPNGPWILIYGHHISGTTLMLSELGDSWQQSRFADLGSCRWSTPDGASVVAWPAFSVKVASDDSLYMERPQSEADVADWLARAKDAATARSRTNAERAGGAPVIVLVTCSSPHAGLPWRCAVTFV